MELPEFNNYIKNLTLNNWNRLFAFIPLIQKTDKFGIWIECDFDKGIPFPYVIPDKLVNDFSELMYELDLVIDFNWTKWEEGKNLIADSNFKNLDTITLFQLLTSIIRVDRFSEGYLVNSFENGTIEVILTEIKLNVENNN